MDKRVYFYRAKLREKRTNKEEHFSVIKEIVEWIINNKSVKASRFNVLNVSERDGLHQVADIFSYEEDYLFMRISNQKPSGSYLYRDYMTNVPEAVLEGASEKEKGIELYTYLFFNYSTGIFGIVSQQGAPNYTIMNTFITKYSNYKLELIPIPNGDGIDRIYKAKEPRISQIEVEVPVPDAGVLQQWFGWDEKEIISVQNGQLKATLRVSGVERQLITSNQKETKSIIDCINRKKFWYNKAKIRGKIEGEKIHDYNFWEENFSYPISITTYRIVNYEKQFLSAEELIIEYKNNLIMAYTTNEKILKLLSQR